MGHKAKGREPHEIYLLQHSIWKLADVQYISPQTHQKQFSDRFSLNPEKDKECISKI